MSPHEASSFNFIRKEMIKKPKGGESDPLKHAAEIMKMKGKKWRRKCTVNIAPELVMQANMPSI